MSKLQSAGEDARATMWDGRYRPSDCENGLEISQTPGSGTNLICKELAHFDHEFPWDLRSVQADDRADMLSKTLQ